MVQYREILTCIDSTKGTLISSDGAKINRDDLLPRLILADEVIFIASFVNVNEINNVMAIEPKSIDESLNFRIIGDCDHDDDTAVMFAGDYIPGKSDLANGRIAFRINSNNLRFKDAMKNARQQKGEFVILAQSADPITTIVLAKDNFIAENRPCENADLEDIPVDEIITKEELQLLLDLKSPLNHTHTSADISDLNIPEQLSYTAGSGIAISATGEISCTIAPGGGVTYTPGDGISISEDNVISCTVEPGGGVTYTPGDGISISEDNVISCTVEPGSGTEYSNGEGLNLNGTAFSVDFDVVAKQADLEALQGTIGDINTILDTINGEVI